MVTINQDFTVIQHGSIVSEVARRGLRSLFIPVYGHRASGIYNIERDGNFLTVLGYIQTIRREDTMYVIAIPELIATKGARYLARVQMQMWERGLNLVYTAMKYGDDPRATRALRAEEMFNASAALDHFDDIYCSPQRAIMDLLMRKAYGKSLHYLAYAIAGEECAIEAYRKAIPQDQYIYERAPTLVGTLDQLKVYSQATRITQGYESGDLLVKDLEDMEPWEQRSCKKPFILMPWKPSHEPYKVPIINDVLYELLQLGYDVFSPYALERSDGTKLHNFCYGGDKDIYLKHLRWGNKCVIPLLEPMHHCLHYTCYEAIANNNIIVTVANEEIPDHEWLVANDQDLENTLLKALHHAPN